MEHTTMMEIIQAVQDVIYDAVAESDGPAERNSSKD